MLSIILEKFYIPVSFEQMLQVLLRLLSSSTC